MLPPASDLTTRALLCSAEVETAFLDKMLTWAAQANSTAGHPLFGLLDLTRVGVQGHSMGGSLAAIAAAEHAGIVRSVVLLVGLACLFVVYRPYPPALVRTCPDPYIHSSRPASALA